MTTMKSLLVTAICGLVLLGTVAAQAMGLRYVRETKGGPNCFESSEVRLIDGQRDIPFTGTLTAVLAPTYAEFACPFVGMIFDDRTTLIVDCLYSNDEIDGFLATARDNAIATVQELTTLILVPCPPPDNDAALEDWRAMLFDAYQLDAVVAPRDEDPRSDAVDLRPTECKPPYTSGNCTCPPGSERPYPPCFW